MANSPNGGEPSQSPGTASELSESLKHDSSTKARMLTPAELDSLRRQMKKVASETRAYLDKSDLIEKLRARMDAAKSKADRNK